MSWMTALWSIADIRMNSTEDIYRYMRSSDKKLSLMPPHQSFLHSVNLNNSGFMQNLTKKMT